MKKLAVLIVLAALSACSDSSNGQAPSEAVPSAAEPSAVEKDVSTTATDGRVAPSSPEASPQARWDELRPAYIAARDEYREIRARLAEKEEELKAARAAQSADETRISQEAEQLRLAFVAAQDKFVPINKEMQALREQIESERGTD